MITPDNEVPLDDSENSDSEDQQSQQDIHSNGFDETPVEENSTDMDILQQSYDASESAYTIKLDDVSKKAKKKE
jgi:hypothetical protein